MLLFACVTSEDIIKVFDTASLKMIAGIRGDFAEEQKIGFRAGTGFGDYTVVAGCYNNRINIIDNRCFKTIKTIPVGAYPVSVVSNKDYVYIACGDSNSIWVMDNTLEVVCVNDTMQFPYAMAVSGDELSICGFTNGEIYTYDKQLKNIKKQFNICGYPYGITYLKGELVVTSNECAGGMINVNGKRIKVGERVGKIVAYEDKLFICVDDIYIKIMDKSLKEIDKITVFEPVSDFTVCREGVYVSELFGNYIKKFSQDGKELGRINVGYSGCSLLLV